VGCKAEVACTALRHAQDKQQWWDGATPRYGGSFWQRSSCYWRDLRGAICKIKTAKPIRLARRSCYILPEVGGFINRFPLKSGLPSGFLRLSFRRCSQVSQCTRCCGAEPNRGLYLVAHHRIRQGVFSREVHVATGGPIFGKQDCSFSASYSTRCARSSRTSSLACPSLSSKRVSEQFPNS